MQKKYFQQLFLTLEKAESLNTHNYFLLSKKKFKRPV